MTGYSENPDPPPNLHVPPRPSWADEGRWAGPLTPGQCPGLLE